MLTKNQAKILGKALLKQMKGKGWKLRIWENLGWHYSVNLGGLSISPSLREKQKTKYFALLSNSGYSGTGEMYWTDSFYATNPNKVVAHQMKIAQTFAAQISATINYIAKATK